MDAVEYLKTLCRMCNAKCRNVSLGKSIALMEVAVPGKKTTRRRPLPLSKSGLLSTP